MDSKSMPYTDQILSAGEVIEHYIIQGLGIGVRQLARALNVAPNRLYQILQNKREITVDTAVRLGHYLNMDPQFWLDIQTRYNVHRFIKNHPSIKDDILPLRPK
jgi:addiction module HigA family antidote